MVNIMKNNDQLICLTDGLGTKFWYLNNRFSQEDGSAIEYFDESKYWFFHYGKYHREDGPAIDYANGRKVWWYQGKRISCSSQEEFNRLIKLKALW